MKNYLISYEAIKWWVVVRTVNAEIFTAVDLYDLQTQLSEENPWCKCEILDVHFAEEAIEDYSACDCDDCQYIHSPSDCCDNCPDNGCEGCPLREDLPKVPSADMGEGNVSKLVDFIRKNGNSDMFKSCWQFCSRTCCK